MSSILKAAHSDNNDLIMSSFAAFEEIIFIGYEYLGDYLEVIANLTYKLIQLKNQDAAIKALNFWITLAKKEQARVTRQEQILYFSQYGPMLIQITFLGLEDCDFDENLPESFDDEDQSVPQLSGDLLDRIVNLIKDNAWEPVFNFFMVKV